MRVKALFLALMLLAGSADGADHFYVQAASAELKSEPKMSATAVATVKRGERLAVSEKTEKWYRVRSGDKSGWIPRLFLSEHKPVGQAELARDIPTNLEKASRQRPNAYTVSAATRGLTGDAPAGRGAKADQNALKRLEKRAPSSVELDNFSNAAKLKTE